MTESNKCIRDLADSAVIGIFGAGGHGREIAWIVEECGIAKLRYRFVVDSKYLDTDTLDGVPVIAYELFAREYPKAPIVVAIGDGYERRATVERLAAQGHSFPILVSPRAAVSPRARLSAGGVVFPHSTISVDTSLGEHVHVNTNCSVSHDVRIGPFSTLSPGATICGHVDIDAGVFIGTNACIVNGSAMQPIVIKEGARVGAGAAVTGSVQAGSFVAGVPAVRKG